MTKEWNVMIKIIWPPGPQKGHFHWDRKPPCILSRGKQNLTKFEQNLLKIEYFQGKLRIFRLKSKWHISFVLGTAWETKCVKKVLFFSGCWQFPRWDRLNIGKQLMLYRDEWFGPFKSLWRRLMGILHNSFSVESGAKDFKEWKLNRRVEDYKYMVITIAFISSPTKSGSYLFQLNME